MVLMNSLFSSLRPGEKISEYGFNELNFSVLFIDKKYQKSFLRSSF